MIATVRGAGEVFPSAAARVFSTRRQGMAWPNLQVRRGDSWKSIRCASPRVSLEYGVTTKMAKKAETCWKNVWVDDYWWLLMIINNDYWWLLMIINNDYWWLMMIIDVYWCILMYIDVYWWLLMYIDVYWCILMYIDVYWCILMYIDVWNKLESRVQRAGKLQILAIHKHPCTRF